MDRDGASAESLT